MRFNRLLTTVFAATAAFAAAATDYTVSLDDDFENASTYTANFRYGALANRVFGTSAIAEQALSSKFTVYASAISSRTSINSKDKYYVGWESRTNYKDGSTSHYFLSWNRYASPLRQEQDVLYVIPASSVADQGDRNDYILEFDYCLAPSRSASGNTATNGLALVGGSGEILATLAVPPSASMGGGTTTGILYRGDDRGDVIKTGIPTASRDYIDNAANWLHITVRADEFTGVKITIVRYATVGGDPVTVLAETVLTDAFDTVAKIQLRASTMIREQATDLDNVLLRVGPMPKTFNWTGAAGDGQWTTPGNWSVGGVAQTTDLPTLVDTSVIDDASVQVALGTTAGRIRLSGDAKIVFDVSSVPKNTKVTLLDFNRFVDTVPSPANVVIAGDGCRVSGVDYGVTERGKLTCFVTDATYFTWTGNGGTIRWSDTGNWKLGDNLPPDVAPGDGDTAVIPSSFSAGVTVLLDADVATAATGVTFQAGCQVDLRSEGGTPYTFYGKGFTGSGILTLSDVAIASASGEGLSINNPVQPGANIVFKAVGAGGSVTLKGYVTGSGTLALASDGSAGAFVEFRNQLASFRGMVLNSTDLRFFDAALDAHQARFENGASATVTIDSSCSGSVLKLGSLTGAGAFVNGRSEDTVVEVGALNADAATTATFGTGIVFRKVGTGRQSLADTSGVFGIDLTAGVLALPLGSGYKAVAKSGGKFGYTIPYADPWTNGTAQVLLTADSGLPAGTLVNSDFVFTFDNFEKSYSCKIDHTEDNVVKVKLQRVYDLYTWTGATGDHLWTTPGNWTVPGGVPMLAPDEENPILIDGDTVYIDPAQPLGEVTLVNNARIAILFRDDATAFKVPGGLSSSGLLAYGPYTARMVGSFFTATRVVSTFAYVDRTGDQKWETPGNWTVNGNPTAVLPNGGDSADFRVPTGTSEVHLSAEHSVSGLVFSTTTKIYGNVIRAYETGGSARVHICDDGGIGARDLPLVIVNGIQVAATAAQPARLVAGPQDLTHTGNLYGAGVLQLAAATDSAGVILKGSNLMTGGTIVVPSAESGDGRNCARIMSTASSPSVIWEIENGAGDRDEARYSFLAEAGGLYRFGSMNGIVNQAGGIGAVILELGELNREDVLSGRLHYDETRWTATSHYGNAMLRKVGDGTLTSTVIWVNDYELSSGVLVLSDNRSRPSPNGYFAFLGGTLRLADTFTADISGSILGSTAPIIVDTATDRTWAAKLDQSNSVHEFVKKGAGTLTLTGVPWWDDGTDANATKVTVLESGGHLVLPKTAKFTLGEHTSYVVSGDSRVFSYGDGKRSGIVFGYR